MHVVATYGMADFWAQCQALDPEAFAGCAREAAKKNPQPERIDAMLPIACYKPRTKRWASGAGCIQRRGLRLSTKSDPERVRPLVLGCHGKAVGVGLQEWEPRDLWMVAPVDAALHFEKAKKSVTPPSATLKATMRKLITTSRAEIPAHLRPVSRWNTLSVTSYPMELDGDGKLDQLLLVDVQQADGSRDGLGAALLASDDKAPFELDHATFVEASMDLDQNGRSELVAVLENEGHISSLWTLSDTGMIELGSVNCWP